MPNPVSSTAPSVCDPSIASCADFPPTPVASAGAASPSIVNLEPVVITGDAGAQELLRGYDASRACGNEKRTAASSCPAIGLGILNAVEGGPLTGLATAFYASIGCGRDLRAFLDCRDESEALKSSAAQVVSDCHDHDGRVAAGASANEIICEVRP